MPLLSDKLRALGVKVGANDLHPSRPPRPPGLDEILGGHTYSTAAGETYIVEEFYPSTYTHGRKALRLAAPRERLAAWCGDERIARLSSEAIAFLDTETTGLSGGTGTYAFLVGAGRMIGDTFHLIQFFMRDPSEEQALLQALESFLAPCEVVVTYNGKAFDVPLLNTRFQLNLMTSPFHRFAHLDLLHLARRLWRNRLPSRTLGVVEQEILSTNRNEEDIPGWLIPNRYFDYLRTGDAGTLKPVFYHNAMDVLSLSALLDHVAGVLHDPVEEASEHGVDLLALARLFEDLGELDLAADLYLHGLQHSDLADAQQDRLLVIQALHRLAGIHKRRRDFDSAVLLWQRAALLDDLDAHLELAKYYEHQARQPKLALEWTEQAILLISRLPFSRYLREQWRGQLAHRKNRLLKKLLEK
jgi:uncharacterized protein YprB with RNaseH-like and TPR domain